MAEYTTKIIKSKSEETVYWTDGKYWHVALHDCLKKYRGLRRSKAKKHERIAAKFLRILEGTRNKELEQIISDDYPQLFTLLQNTRLPKKTWFGQESHLAVILNEARTRYLLQSGAMLVEMQWQIHAKDQEIAVTNELLTTANQQKQAKDAEIVEKDKQLEQAIKTNGENAQKIERLTQENKEKNKQLVQKDEQIQQLNSQYQTVEEQKNALENENAKLNQQLVGNEIKHQEKLLKVQEEHERSREDWEKSKTEMQQRMEELEKQHQEKLKKLTSQKKKEFKALKIQHQQQLKELAEHKEKEVLEVQKKFADHITSLEESNEKLLSELQGEQALYSQLLHARDELSHQREELSSQLAAQKKIVADLNDECDKFSSANKNQKQEIEKLQSDNKHLNEQNQLLTTHREALIVLFRATWNYFVKFLQDVSKKVYVSDLIKQEILDVAKPLPPDLLSADLPREIAESLSDEQKHAIDQSEVFNPTFVERTANLLHSFEDSARNSVWLKPFFASPERKRKIDESTLVSTSQVEQKVDESTLAPKTHVELKPDQSMVAAITEIEKQVNQSMFSCLDWTKKI